jgi:hypothetical protein
MKKIFIALLISFIGSQNLPDAQQINLSFLTAGKNIFSFYSGGMYNPWDTINSTFQKVAIVSVDTLGNKITTYNGKNYMLITEIFTVDITNQQINTSSGKTYKIITDSSNSLNIDNSALKIGYVEEYYTDQLLQTVESLALESTTIFNNNPILIKNSASWGANDFLQTYPTNEGGYVVLLGTNSEGKTNNVDYSSDVLTGVIKRDNVNFTLYRPVYGVEVAA